MYIIRSSLSFAIPSPLQRAITIASFAAATSTYPILPAASAEFTIGFPLERLYTEIPASIAATLEVSSASGTLSKLLCRSSTAHFISSGPSFSAGPILTSRYVAPASSCCFALLRIGSASLSVNALLTAGAVVESLSPIVTNFAIPVFSFTWF